MTKPRRATRSRCVACGRNFCRAEQGQAWSQPLTRQGARGAAGKRPHPTGQAWLRPGFNAPQSHGAAKAKTGSPVEMEFPHFSKNVFEREGWWREKTECVCTHSYQRASSYPWLIPRGPHQLELGQADAARPELSLGGRDTSATTKYPLLLQCTMCRNLERTAQPGPELRDPGTRHVLTSVSTARPNASPKFEPQRHNKVSYCKHTRVFGMSPLWHLAVVAARKSPGCLC